MIISATVDPCLQIRQAIISHLRGLVGGFARPIPVTQIRAILDISGEPKDACGVVVGCENLGDHGGQNFGGVLVDVMPRIIAFSHINEDPDGGICNALVSDIRTAINSITYHLDGWKVAWNGSWRTGETTMDSSYRQMELSATLPLVRITYRDDSNG